MAAVALLMMRLNVAARFDVKSLQEAPQEWRCEAEVDNVPSQSYTPC